MKIPSNVVASKAILAENLSPLREKGLFVKASDDLAHTMIKNIMSDVSQLLGAGAEPAHPKLIAVAALNNHIRLFLMPKTSLCRELQKVADRLEAEAKGELNSATSMVDALLIRATEHLKSIKTDYLTSKPSYREIFEKALAIAH